MVAKQYFKTSFCIKTLFLLVLPYACMADPVNHYFNSDDSTVFKNIDTSSSNLNDSNPVITVNSFNLSRLKSIPEYSIDTNELEEIIKKDQKKNSNRYNLDRLENLSEKLSFYYRHKGLILTKVYFPPQSLNKKSLYLDLVLGEIEQVTSIKSDHYSNDRLTRPFKGLINKPAYIPSLESSLIELNSYPGLSIDTRFQEGSEIGKTKINIHVIDEQITDFNFNLDNYGSEYTGTLRGTFTANLYNIADQADQLNFNALAALNPSNSIFLGASYRFKVSPYFTNPMLNNLFEYGINFTFGYQETQYSVGGEFSSNEIEGKANTSFLQLDKDLILKNSHRLNTGVKLSKKIAKTSQQGDIASEDNLSILTWSTLLRWNDHFGSPSANLIKFDFHKGLPNFAGSTANNDISISRKGIDDSLAPMDYNRYNLILSRNQHIGPYQLLSKINIQYSDDLLLPSEQINLGGASSVRGYLNSDFSGDRSQVISLEVSGNSSARKFSLPISDLKLAAFADHGIGKRFKALPNEHSSAEMTSVGVYAQFINKGKFSSKIELAMPLSDVGESSKNKFEVLFNFDRGF